MRKYLFIVFYFFLTLTVIAQSYNLKFKIIGAQNQMSYILSVYGDDNNLVDSVKAERDGTISYTVKQKTKPGLYRLYFDKDNNLDFIFNNENITLTSVYGFLEDSLKIIESEENKIYYEFLRKEDEFQKKLELLMPVVNYFPKNDKFYNEAASRYNSLQKERDNYLLGKINSYKTSFTSKILKVKRTPFIDASLNEAEKQNFLKKHFWDNVDFSDTSLFYTNVLTSKTLSFLVMFSNRKYPPAVQEESFIQAVDIILPKARANNKTFEFMMNFLMSGFENFNFKRVLTHISENYKLETSCENHERKTTLQKRLASYQELAPGKQVPQIKIKTDQGVEFDLFNFKAEYTLLVFWATWCPHCTQMLPEIKNMYDDQEEKKWEVVAFSLDTNETAWKNYIAQNKLTWINISDLKSWDSKTADDYCIYASPTMFLLNNKKQIISKPLTHIELKTALNEVLNK